MGFERCVEDGEDQEREDHVGEDAADQGQRNAGGYDQPGLDPLGCRRPRLARQFEHPLGQREAFLRCQHCREGPAHLAHHVQPGRFVVPLHQVLFEGGQTAAPGVLAAELNGLADLVGSLVISAHCCFVGCEGRSKSAAGGGAE
ncbi:MAG TPA: hypothetical protein PKH24_18715 [Sedimentisphaerales bacterium]|jgi:hypothetical protein|nr:hypothetical protein [Sedimentisphaerales bacterium]HNU31047.1 hypothetical protein [Sedimentisphaerales bacterium]